MFTSRLSLLLLLFAIPSESLKCYECTGHVSCGTGNADQLVQCSGKCMVYRNQFDGGNLVRRCCTNDCGGDGLGIHEGRNPVYFCSDDACNGEIADTKLGSDQTDSSSSPSGLTSNQVSSSTNSNSGLLSCYECTDHNPSCGTGEMQLVHRCDACMVYRNQFDSNTIIRRCCTQNCGSSGTVSEYEGRQAYFCRTDQCNGKGTEGMLGSGGSTSTQMTATAQPSLSCYTCDGSNGQTCTSTVEGCPMCMIARNENDPTKFDRHCCWWGCGTSGQLSQFAGRPTYFCNSNLCNVPENGAALGHLTTSTTTTTTTQKQTSFECYSCSGIDCGRQGSPVSSGCPSCMIYRDPYNRNQIERKCCWWACGAPNTVSAYNGIPTYFCTSDKCNGNGAEYALGNSGLTTTPTTTTTAPSTTLSNCRLNCQNGGTLESEDGCFCYCVENTSGRECEQIDCTQPNSDTELCSADNEPLCAESELFSYECLHLCGKC